MKKTALSSDFLNPHPSISFYTVKHVELSIYYQCLQTSNQETPADTYWRVLVGLCEMSRPSPVILQTWVGSVYTTEWQTVFRQYHIANMVFSHPIVGSALWPELASSLAEYLHCRLFFPKCIVTISLHFSKMKLILLSFFLWNYLGLLYPCLVCVLVFFTVSSAKDIHFLKRMPFLTTLKKILNIKCSNNVSFRYILCLTITAQWVCVLLFFDYDPASILESMR